MMESRSAAQAAVSWTLIVSRVFGKCKPTEKGSRRARLVRDREGVLAIVESGGKVHEGVELQRGGIALKLFGEAIEVDGVETVVLCGESERRERRGRRSAPRGSERN